MVADVTALVTALHESPVPVVAHVNGAVAGGALGAILQCDLITAVADAVFMMPFVPLGLIPDTLILPAMSARIGQGRTRALAVTGGSMAAEPAQAIGLVDQIVPDEVAAVAIACRMGRAPAGTHRALRQLFDVDHAAIAREAKIQAERLAHPETRTAISRLRERISSIDRSDGKS